MNEVHPTYDRASELHAEAVDRAEKRLRNGDWDMADLRDTFFNVPNLDQDKLHKASRVNDLLDLGRTVQRLLYEHLLEQEET